MNRYTEKDYTFVICAYKESKYLEECIQSLKKQNISVNIILVTSTPNLHIESLVKKYALEYYINNGKSGIAEDWNFAYASANTKLVTIAHQDDIYTPEFSSNVLEQINNSCKPLIAFTNYGELREQKYILKNKLLMVKRILLSPLKIKALWKVRFVRRRILSIGSAICCPSVTLVKENLPQRIFESKFKSNVDWEAWEKISKLKGDFVYCKDILMYHRIHEESTTTEIIADNNRIKEDFEMFCKFWPRCIARFILFFYKQGEKSNEI